MIDQGKSTNAVLKDFQIFMRNSESDKNQYLNTLYGNECEILKQIRASAPKDKAHMQIYPFEGEIITFFANLINAKIIIEIGTFVGYSASYVALKLNSSSLVIHSIEKNPDYFKIAENNIFIHKLENRIKLYKGDALEFLSKIESDGLKADLVFIDGKKSQYCEYLDLSSKLLRAGGLVIADNTMLFDNVYKKDENSALLEAMRDFNEKIAHSKIFKSIIIPTLSGMTVAIKNT